MSSANGLADEKKRWQSNIKNLKASFLPLIGDVFIVSGMLCYGGPFNMVYRGVLYQLLRTKSTIDPNAKPKAKPRLFQIQFQAIQKLNQMAENPSKIDVPSWQTHFMSSFL